MFLIFVFQHSGWYILHYSTYYYFNCILISLLFYRSSLVVILFNVSIIFLLVFSIFCCIFITTFWVDTLFNITIIFWLVLLHLIIVVFYLNILDLFTFPVAEIYCAKNDLIVFVWNYFISDFTPFISEVEEFNDLDCYDKKQW